jgi:hypothetical protein
MAEANQTTAPVIGTPEYEAAMVAKADAAFGTEPEVKTTVDATAKTEEQQPERPAWLNSKFKSPEELAKAYEELEKKQSQAKPAAPAQEQPKENTEAKPEGEGEVDAEGKTEEGAEGDQAAKDALASVGVDYDALATEFESNGTLSDDSYKALQEKAGLSREYVDAYIAGQAALAREATQRVFDIAGGEEQYGAMTEWAKANLTPAEIAAYNQGIEGTAEQAALAAAGLKSKYIAANGSEPKLITGSSAAQVSQGFASRAEMTAAMNDPRYAKDAAYRKQVENKIAISNIF